MQVLLELEHSLGSKERNIQYSIGGWTYRVDWASMEQVNIKTNTCRSVLMLRRCVYHVEAYLRVTHLPRFTSQTPEAAALQSAPGEGQRRQGQRQQ